jgi:DUF1680 family protein
MITSLRLPDIKKIQIDDALWSYYANMVAEKIVPYQWDILNDRILGADPDYNNWNILDSQAGHFAEDGVQQATESYCIRNFRIAAGELEGEHKGVIFIDTDVYKWLETVAYCLHNGKCREFESIADEVISLLGRAQQDDGYLNTYYTIKEPDGRWSNLVEGHELYSAGHLIEAAIAYYQATGKDTLLIIARRFADLICKVFGPEEGQLKGYPGHQEIELALVKLYHTTNERRYLECARFFIDQRGTEPNYFKAEIEKRGGRTIFKEFSNYDLKYSQAHIPVRQQKSAEGHAVRAVYMYSAMADLASEYGDEELLDACRTLWHNVTQRRMYITGGIGSSGELERFTTDYHLPNDSGYCETCASIGLALFGRRMALIERDAAYYDVVERALYNRILAGISTDGQRYFYASPLEVWPDACMDGTSLKHVKPVRQRWFSVACCPTNLARTLASLGQYIYAQSDDTVYVNLFISSSFDAVIGGSRAVVTTHSKLVQEGKVVITVKSEEHLPFSLAIRIPDYADKPAFLLDGKAINPDIRNSYAIISGDFSGKHIISVDFHVKPQWIAADPHVRADAGKIALTKGPLVYCLEETDNGSNLASVYADPETEVEESTIDDLPGNLPALNYEGKRLTRAGWNGKLYDRAHFEMENTKLKAVPYGLWGNRDPGEMIVWQNALISKD